MFQALYTPTEGPGTFVVDVQVDGEACAALLTPTKAADVSPRPSMVSHFLVPSLHLASSNPRWASEVQVAVATVALDAAGVALQDTFYPYYGSTIRKIVVPKAPTTFQSEFWPYAIVHLSKGINGSVVSSGQPLDVASAKSTQYVQPTMHVKVEHVREGGFMLHATVNSYVSAAVNYAIVEAGVATGVFSAAADPRRAILCALELCIDDADAGMWPAGSIVATGTMLQSRIYGAYNNLSLV
jgi:hypothetical protein